MKTLNEGGPKVTGALEPCHQRPFPKFGLDIIHINYASPHTAKQHKNRTPTGHKKEGKNTERKNINADNIIFFEIFIYPHMHPIIIENNFLQQTKIKLLFIEQIFLL